MHRKVVAMRKPSLVTFLMILCVLCIFLLTVWHGNWMRSIATDTYENIAYTLSPSPARAFAYGERHFDSASDPANYDINRAQYFFDLVLAKDPTYPYLYHELARISFLKGNFVLALSQINTQISMHGNSEPNSYYVRGLIEGYMGDYADSDKDYKHFISFDPLDWAAKNDDAWVLLKAQRYTDALSVINSGLVNSPNNPWLLNSKATALYELRDYKTALTAAQAAQRQAAHMNDAQWSHAYPGNDPAIAGEGLDTFKNAIDANIHTITLALATSTVQ